MDNPVQYVTNFFSSAGIVVVSLTTCAVGELYLNELEGAVEDLKASNVEWIDILVSIRVYD